MPAYDTVMLLWKSVVMGSFGWKEVGKGRANLNLVSGGGGGRESYHCVKYVFIHLRPVGMMEF